MLDKVKELIIKGADCESTGDLEGLFACIKEAMKLDGQNYELFYMLGNYHYMKKQYEQAFLCYEQAELYCDNDDRHEIIHMKECVKEQFQVDVRNISIVIVSYNIRDLMMLCIKSIRATLKKGTYEIIVADNASTDGIREWLAEQEDVRHILNTTNCGFPEGCNQGIRAAVKGNDIFLLNNDTVLTPNAVFWLRMGLYSDRKVGTAGSITNYASNGQKILIDDPTPDGYLKAAKHINVPMESPYEYKTWLVGFALLIKNKMISQVGTLDERFSPGNYEDYDYGLRVQKAGFYNVLCRNSFILHWGGQNFARDTAKLKQTIDINRHKLAEKWNKKTKQILLITHQLSYTGAPVALMQLAETLLENGFTVDVISLKDGEQKIQYDKLGIACWVIENLTQNEEELEKLLGVYDAIIVNTLAGALICQFLSGKDENVYWWIHENELLFEQIKGYLKQLKLEKNIRVLAAGYYVQEQIKKYMACDSKVLNICIPDIRKQSATYKHDKIRFAQIGLIDGMKGQEVFLGAILSLPEEIRSCCEFYICGSMQTANKEIIEMIKRAQKLFPCIHLLDSMEQVQLYEFYEEIDCIVVPSRIESMSAVMVEGFMKEKVCICTATTGISKYMDNGTNGFIFPVGDIEALKDIMKYIVINYKKLCDVKQEGRKIYEKYFSPKCFRKKVQQLIIGEL